MTRARDNSFNPSNDQAAGKNLIINGGFDIWQRGTSFTTDAAATVIYTADRISAFALFPGAGATQTITRETSTSHIPSNFKYSLKSVVSTAVPVNAGRMLIGYTMEHQDSLSLAGRTVTYSMQVKAIGNIDRVYLYSRYNTSGGNALSGAVDASNAPFTVNSSSFTTITWTTTVPSAATLTSTGTYGFQLVYYRANGAVEAVGDGIYIAGLQLEIGNVATSFSRAGGTIGGELALCQRYYEKSFPVDVSPANGLFYAGGLAEIMYSDLWALEGLTIPFKVPKRITPSINFFGATSGTVGGWQQYTSNAWVTWASVSAPGRGQQISTNQFSVQMHNNGSSGFGVGTVKAIQGDWVASAEL
jgi:hypothetical protein